MSDRGATEAAKVQDTPGPQPRVSHADRVPALAWLIAGLFVILELAISARYGFQQDELYFIVAAHHLAFGYVDQPPLAPLLTRVTSLFGVSPTAIRVIPALLGGAVVVAAARLAALFGAGRRGRVLAALFTACAPVLVSADHVANTTPVDLIAWTMVVLCVCTALLRDKPRWWLGAGVAAGLGLENNFLMVLLMAGLAIGILASAQRPVLGTRWPWLAAATALAIWLPNLVWQATHGWPQLAMSSALHQENSSPGDYVAGVPEQLLAVGLLVTPMLVAGFVRLWRTPELRFVAIATALILLYVLAWVPGKQYYTDGLAPAVLAAGSAATEQWIAGGRRQLAASATDCERLLGLGTQRVRAAVVVAAPLVGLALICLLVLPVLPVTDLHSLPATAQHESDTGDTVGWPQLTSAVASQDAAMTRAGQPPTSIFAGFYGEAAALDVLGSRDHLPPVLSGNNAYWMWGSGNASDHRVLFVDALGQLRRYFASCRVLTTYHAPYRLQNDWTDLQIGVCTRPAGNWHTLWPHLKHYG